MSMKEKFVKRHKKALFLIGGVVFLVIVGCLFAPNIDRILCLINPGRLSADAAKKQMLQKEDTQFFKADNSYWSSGSDSTHVPSEEDVFFRFDKMVKLGDGIYITDGWGLTNWCARVRIYSRNDFTLANPAKLDNGGYANWSFYAQFNGSEENEFPYKRNEEQMLSPSFTGCSANVFLAAPAKINEDDTVTLVYYTGKDFREKKEIKIPVSVERIFR